MKSTKLIEVELANLQDRIIAAYVKRTPLDVMMTLKQKLEMKQLCFNLVRADEAEKKKKK